MALVAAILVGSGAAFKVTGRGPGTFTDTPLRRNFDGFPREFLGYQWSKNKPLDEDTERVLNAKAYLNREGFRSRDKSLAMLWVSYFGESETLVEHEPQVCMAAGGWSLPYGIHRTTVPMPPGPDGKSWDLPVNVYLFRKDVNRLFLVNTYCVNGTYTNSRDEARILSRRGVGFYAQTRVTIRLGDVEWGRLRARMGSRADPYAPARDRGQLEAELARLAAAGRAGAEATEEKAHPVVRAAEILQFVIPELEAYLPAPSSAAGGGAADG
jgi:hypothetical protein